MIAVFSEILPAIFAMHENAPAHDQQEQDEMKM